MNTGGCSEEGRRMDSRWRSDESVAERTAELCCQRHPTTTTELLAVTLQDETSQAVCETCAFRSMLETCCKMSSCDRHVLFDFRPTRTELAKREKPNVRLETRGLGILSTRKWKNWCLDRRCGDYVEK
ncbi:hypothetical protein K0M31_014902 [Melipona bicolor]|uniref:Uncharacterized protein n=1 Tax=Melipona bicolor TaxID=60889 RepID=A0AA40FGI3_9HYME|nr:hypothetical protein K0M31_014902 [Melipona bicolor]